MIDGIMDFLADGLIKFVSRLPVAPFSFDDYISAFSSYLGWINWFIPFYIFEEIFSVWFLAFSLCCSILITIRVIMQFAHS